MKSLPIKSRADVAMAIRAARKAGAQLRQDEAALLCGVSLPVLNKIERGEGEVWVSKLLAVCQGLGIKITFEIPE